MAIVKRCIRCRKPTRPDGTCQNPACVRYVPDEPETTNDETTNDKEQGGE